MKTFAACCIASVLTTLAASAVAGVELPEEDLLEMADVVAEVEVTATACVEAKDTADATIRSYGSTMTTLEVLKGELEDTFSYSVTQTEYDPDADMPSCTDAEYVLPQGWVGRVYLMNTGPGEYVIRDLGGAVVDQNASVMHELPVCEPQTDMPCLDASCGNDDLTDSDPSTGDASSGGCSVSGPADASAWWLLAGLGVVAARRRRS